MNAGFFGPPAGCSRSRKDGCGRGRTRKTRDGFMSENGLKITEFVKEFDLEVLNEGHGYDQARLTITDVNRPGLQFHDFYDYFDPRRLQVIGKAEVTYLGSLTETQRRKCFDDLFL